ncbi:glycosyltransferase [Microbulbifer sp. CAU 1566]|uniref:glycosyltransferase n=1 Tax=Microbulbifer sp. CAU 1566 TaxID=2933269 RepID=UPI002006A22F|nr:glycosyltransferase [Microbulbifer sp. CAU 1566]MCK7597116.1 glycosyltransferase [Microbulbifer sp. CAU 1566]
MRIVQLVPSLEEGEQALEALAFAQELVRQGHESIVVSAGGALVSRLTLHGCQHVSLPVDRKRVWNFRLHRKLREQLAASQADILFCRGPLCSWHGWKVWRGLNAAARPRLITSIQSWSPPGLFRGRRVNAALARGELVLASSRLLGAQLQQRFGARLPVPAPGEVDAPSESVLRIHYRGVNTRELDRKAPVSGHWHQRLLNDFPQLEGRNWLLLPGTIAPGRGQERFLELLAAMKGERADIFGLIVGDVEVGQEKYARALEKRAESMGLGEHVLFLGARRDMRELYASARITLDLAEKPPSNGRIVSESLAMGCPAVTSAGPGSEILQQCFPQGLLENTGVEHLLAVCVDILNRPQHIDFRGFSLAETTAEVVGWFHALPDTAPQSAGLINAD